MPLPVQQYSPYYRTNPTGIQEGIGSVLANRLTRAKAVAQEEENPYIGRKSLADAINKELVNKYYGRNIESEIGYRSAGSRHMGMEDKKIQQLLDYPGLDQTGYIGQVANARYMSEHPEIAKSIQEALGQQQQQQIMQQQIQQQQAMQGASPEDQRNINNMKPGDSYVIGSGNKNGLGQSVGNAMRQQQGAQPGYQGEGSYQGTGTNTQFNPVKAMLEHEPYHAGNGLSSIRGVDAQDQYLLREQIKRDYGVDDAKANEIANAWQGGESTLPDGTPTPPPQGSAETILSSMHKHVNTAQGINQERFANTLEGMFKMADENADAAFDFSGAAAKIPGGIDALASQVGEADPKYLKYRKFVNEDVPGLVTEIVRTSGANSTDAQKAMAIKQAMPMNMLTSPEVAKASYGELKKLYRGVAKSIGKSPYQINRENKSQSQGGENSKSSSSSGNTYYEWNGNDLVESK